MSVFKNLGVNGAEREQNRFICPCGRTRNQYTRRCVVCDISPFRLTQRYELDFHEIKEYMIAIEFPNAEKSMDYIFECNVENMEGRSLPVWICDITEDDGLPEIMALYQKIIEVWKLPSDVDVIHLMY